MDTRRFPITCNGIRYQVPWSVVRRAYQEYVKRYGDYQTMERLAERGGFSGGEMDALYPDWRFDWQQHS